MLKRPVNVGFSGGEKKRAEILQMAVLEPTLCVLDETDCGLDIDALRVVADGVNALRRPTARMLVITHYQRLLDYIVPDVVHVLSEGRIVKSGDKEPGARARSEGLCRVREGRGMNIGACAGPLRKRRWAFQLPHRRMEEWRWTDLRQLIDKPYPPRQQVAAGGGATSSGC